METNLPLHLLATFQRHFPSESPQWIVHMEGYNVWVAAIPDDVPEFTLVSADQAARTMFTLQSAKHKQTVLKRPLPRWARYAAGVVLELYGDTGFVQNEAAPKGIRAAMMNLESGGPRYEYGIGWGMTALWYHILDRTFTTHEIHDVLDKVRREYIE